MSAMPEQDPRLRSPWGPARASVGWWAKPISDAVINEHIVNPETGLMTAEFGYYVANVLIGSALKMMGESLAEAGASPDTLGQAQANMMRLRLLAPAWAHFIACGEQVVDFSPSLVKTLNRKDPKHTTLAGVKSPFQSFFVRFGQQDSLSLPWEDKAEYVDGAFSVFSRMRARFRHSSSVSRWCLRMVKACCRKGRCSTGWQGF